MPRATRQPNPSPDPQVPNMNYGLSLSDIDGSLAPEYVANHANGSRRRAFTPRHRNGCLTCRLRRKGCTDLNANGSCTACVQRSFECLGYQSRYPQWMKVGSVRSEIKEALVKHLANHDTSKGFLSFESYYSSSGWCPNFSRNSTTLMVPAVFDAHTVSSGELRIYEFVRQFLSGPRMFMYRMLEGQHQSHFDDQHSLYEALCTHKEASVFMSMLIKLHCLGRVPIRDYFLRNQGNAMRRFEERVRRDPLHTGNIYGAILGISTSLFLGGRVGWESCVTIGVEWLVRNFSSIMCDNAPPSNVTLALMVIWFDTLGAVSRRQKPMIPFRLLKFMLRPGSPLQLNQVMGCDNKVMLGIAAIARLEMRRSQNQILTDGHMLHMYSRIYEKYLKNDFVGPLPEVHVTFREQSHASNQSSAATPSIPLGARLDFSTSTTSIQPLANQWCRAVLPTTAVTSAFRAAALVLLAAVVREMITCDEMHKEVDIAVQNAISLFCDIPASDADRNLIFPLCAVACHIDVSNHWHRSFFAARFRGLDGSKILGNCHHAEELVHKVWNRRHAASLGCTVDTQWIGIMGHHPLLLA